MSNTEHQPEAAETATRLNRHRTLIRGETWWWTWLKTRCQAELSRCRSYTEGQKGWNCAEMYWSNLNISEIMSSNPKYSYHQKSRIGSCQAVAFASTHQVHNSCRFNSGIMPNLAIWKYLHRAFIEGPTVLPLHGRVPCLKNWLPVVVNACIK